MEQSPAAFSCDQNLQRLAAKSSCAADFLRNAASVAENWHKKHKKVNRYIQQAKLIVTWRRGCGALKMVGSATKTLGGVMVVAAPLHPQLGLAVRAGHRLWKLGAGLKILTAVASLLRDLWQVGCRNSLLEFVTVTTHLTHNLGVFGEVIRDLQKCAQSLSASNNTQTSDQVFSLLRPFISTDQLEYVRHVVNIVFHNTSYSPLFDFILTSSDLTGERSNIAQLMQEIESFRFTEFLEQGSSQFLAAIGSFLHISRELLDFLDGFQKVTEQDCRFLHECLTRFSQESASIQRAASTLTNLAHMGGHASTLTDLAHMGGLHLSPGGTNMSSLRDISEATE